jgi:hypothetical protein
MNPAKHCLFTIAALATFNLWAPACTYAAAGDLYQADPQHGSINRYSPGNGTPTTFVSGITGLTSRIAFNRAGDLFVGDVNGILKITPAGTKSTFVTGVKVNGIRCDAAGNVFVSDGTSRSILKITPAGVKSTFAPAIIDTLDLVFDTNGDLLAVDYGADPANPNGPGINGQGKIHRFTPDGTHTVSKASIDRPTCMAIDSKGHTYLGNSDGTIHVGFIAYGGDFNFGGSGLFTGGLGNIQSMACDPAGNLFVSTPSGIIKFEYKTSAKSTFSQAATDAGIAFEPPRGLALNISTRLGVQGGDNALIAGFIIAGPDHKSVIIRGMGPSLGKLGVAGALQDPTIEMHLPTGVVTTNDNWKDGATASTIQGGPFQPGDDRESLLQYNIPPGNYSVIEKGKLGTAGIGLVEVYDIGRLENSNLANISTRGFVGAGDNVMIGGFILGAGNGAARIMIRAIGPSLAAFGVSNPLQNPSVSLRDGNGAVLSSNDDWAQNSNATEIYLTGIAPSNQAESAILMTLPAGTYTAVVAGVNGDTGIGLVEVYNLQ